MFVIDIGTWISGKLFVECMLHNLWAEYSVRSKQSPIPISLATLRGTNMFLYIICDLFCRYREHCFPSDVSLYNCGLSVVSIYMCGIPSNLSLILVCSTVDELLILLGICWLTGSTTVSRYGLHGMAANHLCGCCCLEFG